MKIFFSIALLATLSILTACQRLDKSVSPTDIKPPDNQLIWVSQVYVGGKQCDPSDNYVPPDAKTILGGVGVLVFDTTIELYDVCAVCSCPAYAAMHYALIKEYDLQKAQELGFEQKDPPK